MSSYDAWKLRSDRDDAPQDELPVDEGKPDQQEDGFLELVTAAKDFVAAYAEQPTERLAQIAEWGLPIGNRRLAKAVIAFRAALAKLEP